MHILFVILLIVGVVALGFFQYLQQHRRRTELGRLALKLGLSFRAERDPGLSARYDAFDCLRKGANRYAYNVLAGTYRRRSVCAFDYHYETYSTDSKGNRQTHAHEFSAVLVETGLPLRPLAIRPEGFFDKIGEFFGIDDIDFESNDFSRAFHVTSPDRRWAFDVLHQETMEYLLQAPRFQVEMAGSLVIVFRSYQFAAGEIEQALQVGGGIIDRLPNYLLREWKGAV